MKNYPKPLNDVIRWPTYTRLDDLIMDLDIVEEDEVK